MVSMCWFQVTLVEPHEMYEQVPTDSMLATRPWTSLTRPLVIPIRWCRGSSIVSMCWFRVKSAVSHGIYELVLTDSILATRSWTSLTHSLLSAILDSTALSTSRESISNI